jgi:lipopolysaccharide transport system permease protein
MQHCSPTYVIDSRGRSGGFWSELWRHRELLALLARKDLVVRYKETAIGVTWVILKPALTLAIFTVVFGRIANLPSGGVPYAPMVLAGLLPWLFFVVAAQSAGDSLVSNAGLLGKVYFPRAILPLSAILVCLLDLAIGGVLFIPLGLFYSTLPDWRVGFLPALVLLLLLMAAGAGIWLAAVTARYRDFRHVTPFVMQLSLYASPVAYSSSVIPDKWRFIFDLNPLVGIIEGFRWALFAGKVPFPTYAICVSVTFALVSVATGALFFRRTERQLVDWL